MSSLAWNLPPRLEAGPDPGHLLLCISPAGLCHHQACGGERGHLAITISQPCSLRDSAHVGREPRSSPEAHTLAPTAASAQHPGQPRPLSLTILWHDHGGDALINGFCAVPSWWENFKEGLVFDVP